MTVLLAIAHVLLGFVFLLAGSAKLPFGTGLPPASEIREAFVQFGYPVWFRYLTGALEIGAALLVLAGFAVPVLAAVGAALLVCIMLGALATHLRVRSGVQKVAPVLVLLALSAWVATAHWPL